MHVAILGTGTMGRAIIGGLFANNRPIAIRAYDTSPQARSAIPKEVTVAPPDQWFSANAAPDAVIFAVKPADLAAACEQVAACSRSSAAHAPLWISIAAGIGIGTLQKHLSTDSRICRVMPNTPARIGEGMSAWCCNNNCTDGDRTLVEGIFSTCGKTIAVPEKLMHAITGLSGSGPAYVFLFLEALIEGGVTAGLPLSIARECAVQTVLGAAKMAAQSGEHTGALKAGVMSPGGTTAAGLRALEEHAFKHAIIEAVTAAAARSAQLGE
ncbi:MAG: pyrroline-5-carboxylate reductase [Chitinispirillaceae bacterium]|nr:pyrroline-5-carboxylate reductase [Chitinispirillaceae bacterium]